jgi:hypothetical protein
MWSFSGNASKPGMRLVRVGFGAAADGSHKRASPCYCNEKINTDRLQIIGVAISPAIANPKWAARARRSLKFCEMQVHLVASA